MKLELAPMFDEAMDGFDPTDATMLTVVPPTLTPGEKVEEELDSSDGLNLDTNTIATILEDNNDGDNSTSEIDDIKDSDQMHECKIHNIYNNKDIGVASSLPSFFLFFFNKTVCPTKY